MNKRIKELDKAAQKYAARICGNDEDSNYNEWFNVYKAKFAETIVKECAVWMENATVSDSSGNKNYIGDSFFWSQELKKHFGVES